MKKNIQRILFILIAFFVFVAVAKENEVQEQEDEENREEIQEKVVEVVEKKEIGEFILTAYCPCELCCEEYALNRPIDENGEVIVYGSTGERLFQGVSIAVDPAAIPYGTKVDIDGRVYTAQDCGGAIQGNRIDVYFDNHEDALDFGVQEKIVYVIPEAVDG